MNDAFEALFTQHAISSYAKQLALIDVMGDASHWNVDLKEGTLTLGDKTYKAGLLGSYNKGDHSWLWVWANEHMSHLPDHVTRVAKQMRDLGEKSDIPVFLDATTPDLSDDECHRLAMVVVGIASSECGAYYRGPYGGGSSYLLIQEPLPRNPERHSMLRIQRVIMECIAQFFFKGTHHEAILSYFRAEGLNVESAEPSKIVAAGTDGNMIVHFDERGRVTKMDGVLRGGATHSSKAPSWCCCLS
jgi:hypothetical protein